MLSVLIAWAATFWACRVATAAGPNFPGWFRFETYQDDAGEHRYAIYVPQAYAQARLSPGEGASSQKWPVMLFLHGAGERGTDGYRQLTVGLGPVLRRRPDFPFIVVFPQAEDVGSRYLTGWLAETPDARRALKILEKVEREYEIDPDRRVLAGWSMGGYGAWSIAAAHPRMWSAVLPISGGGDPTVLEELAEAGTPVWAIHGAEDSLVRPEQSRKMVASLQQLGGNAVETEIPGVGHDVGPIVFRNDAVLRWLLGPGSIESNDIDWQPAIAAARRDRAHLVDFIPTAIGRRVIGVRLGNDALRTLAEGIPEAIPPEALAGTLSDIVRSFGEGNQRAEVRFSNISYQCRVTGSRIAAVSGGRFRVCFALAPVSLRFEHTAITGNLVQAEAGAFHIELGTQRPVWLEIEVRPEAATGKIRLTSLQQRFHLTDDNWYVSPPENVRVASGQFKPEHIVAGIVGGTYLNRQVIEEQVRGVVPALLKTIEDRLSQIDTSHLTAALWPLPVLSPQLRLRPAAIQTDGGGVSVLLDILVGFPSVTRPPKTLRSLPVAPLSFHQLGKTRDLDVLAQLDVVSGLSAAAVEQGDARINVLDIPEPSFARFAEADFVRSVLPNVPNELTEFRAVVSLVKPFDLQLIDAHDGFSTLELQSHGLLLTFQGWVEDGPHWKTVGTFELSVRQRLSVETVSGSGPTGGLRLQWEDGAVVTARPSATKSTPAQTAQLTDQFRSAWSAWATSQPEKLTQIPDIEAGNAALSWRDLAWRSAGPGAGTTAELQFGTPTISVVNKSSRAVFYEVHGESSPWSGPFLLTAGETHRYHVGYPLTWREFKVKGPTDGVYTIRPGGTLTYGPREQVRLADDDQ